MDAKFFKSTGAIIIYSIITFGLLAIAGYNFWGWFGGSTKWKEENPDKLKDGEPCVLASEPAYIEGVIRNGKCVARPAPNERINTTLVNENNSIEGTASPSGNEEQRAMSKQKWNYTSASYIGNDNIWVFIGATKFPNKYNRMGQKAEVETQAGTITVTFPSALQTPTPNEVHLKVGNVIPNDLPNGGKIYS